MKKQIAFILLASISLWVFAAESPNKSEPIIYPTAIFTFAERGKGVQSYGAKVGDIMFAALAARPEMYLVERDEMEKILQELALNQSGMVSPDQAAKVGQLTGAKILLTGSVIESEQTLYLVAKIIGTETSRVLGESIKGKPGDNLPVLVEKLAGKVVARITAQADSLMPKVVKLEDRIAELNKKLEGAKRPLVRIQGGERHIGNQATMDAAAEAELTLFCKETGFEVLDSKAADRKADIVLQYEGFSEFAVRHGSLASVKARLEVKAIDQQTEKVVATDRQITVDVDLTEQIAGKKALQDAAAAIAERLLPKIVSR
jgi:TolB-like protein